MMWINLHHEGEDRPHTARSKTKTRSDVSLPIPLHHQPIPVRAICVGTNSGSFWRAFDCRSAGSGGETESRTRKPRSRDAAPPPPREGQATKLESHDPENSLIAKRPSVGMQKWGRPAPWVALTRVGGDLQKLTEWQAIRAARPNAGTYLTRYSDWRRREALAWHAAARPAIRPNTVEMVMPRPARLPSRSTLAAMIAPAAKRRLEAVPSARSIRVSGAMATPKWVKVTPGRSG